MKLKTLIITCISAALLATSCIKEEGLDREADILSMTIESPLLLTTVYDGGRAKISLIMEDTTSYYNATITPTIEISPGAKISPASGEAVTLKDYKYNYTITAESGENKTYTVVVEPLDQLTQDFENWDIVGAGTAMEYLIPSHNMWVNANKGVKLVYREYEEFPTSRSEEIRPGSKGKYSAKLSTVKGNSNKDSDAMDIPVFAGNMYRGEFDASVALWEPLNTTKFGHPYPKFLGKPLKLRAWYKYKSGNDYTTWTYEQGKKKKIITTIPGKKDKLDIYAVLYKVPKGKEGVNVLLTATDIKTSDKIVATAFMKDQTERADWDLLETDFTMKEELNFDKYDYKLTIVLSSSEDGANYNGAIGSVLLVDDLEVITELSPAKE